MRGLAYQVEGALGLGEREPSQGRSPEHVGSVVQGWPKKRHQWATVLWLDQCCAVDAGGLLSV